jgi:hypothetical protein
MKIQDPISKQTLMNSNAQLRLDDPNDDVPPPPHIPVAVPDMASSSHIASPPQQDVSYAQILEALASI